MIVVFDIHRTVLVIYSYNKSQPDALFLKFIFDKELYMFRTDLLSIIRDLKIVYAAIGICHASCVDCLLARSGWSYFYKELYMFRTDLLPIIRSLNTVYTAICICHASYVDCLLAWSGWSSSWPRYQSTQLACQLPIAACTVLRSLMMDSRSVRNM